MRFVGAGRPNIGIKQGYSERVRYKCMDCESTFKAIGKIIKCSTCESTRVEKI